MYSYVMCHKTDEIRELWWWQSRLNRVAKRPGSGRKHKHKNIQLQFIVVLFLFLLPPTETCPVIVVHSSPSSDRHTVLSYTAQNITQLTVIRTGELVG